MTNPEIKIRRATPDDAESTYYVLRNTWLATYPNEEHGITRQDIEYRYRDEVKQERIEKRRKMLGELTENDLVLVAQAGEKVVGVVAFEKEDGKNILRAIYILPEFQGMGIGKKFWEEGKKFFGNEDVYVSLAVYNTKAAKFYESLGFVDTGRRFSDERFRMQSGALLPEMEMVLRQSGKVK